MERPQKDIRHDLKKLDDWMFENDIFIRASRKLYLKSYGKPENGINSSRRNSRRVFSLKKHLPGRLTVGTTICFGNDVTKLYTKKWKGGYKFIKSQEKINYLMYMDNIKIFTKNEKELETLTNYWNLKPR